MNAEPTTRALWRSRVVPTLVKAAVAVAALALAMLASPVPSSWAAGHPASLRALTAISITPDTGPTNGGQLVTISGSDFVVDSTSVTIGSVVIAPQFVTVTSPTSLEFTTPIDVAGSVSVSVTTPDGTSSPSLTYTYVEVSPLAAPTITSPSDGSVLTDGNLLISGTGLQGYTVTVREGPTTICAAIVDSSGIWSCRPDTALSLGPHTLTASQQPPSYGPSSASVSVTVTVREADVDTGGNAVSPQSAEVSALAFTGAPWVVPTAIAAAVAVGGGLVVVLLGSRSRVRRSPTKQAR